MTRRPPTAAPRRRHARAMTLVEVLIASAVLGGLMAAVLAAVASTAKARVALDERRAAAALAEALLDEIRSKPYPHDGPPIVALDAFDTPVNRTNFNDLSDYDAYRETPPRLRDGTVLAEFTGWSRAVTVTPVSATDFTSPIDPDEGFKLITVDVRHGKRLIVTLKAVRTLNADSIW